MSDAASQEVLNPGFVLAPNQPLAVSREAFIRHRQMFFDILRYAEQVSQVFCARISARQSRLMLFEFWR